MGLLESECWPGKIYSDGWKRATGGDRAVCEPATGECLARVGYSDPEDIERATRIAVEAQRHWWACPASERREVFYRAAHLLEVHHNEICEWIVREGGAIPMKAHFEVRGCLDELQEAAAIPTSPTGYVMPGSHPGQMASAQLGQLSLARRIPRGVVGVISPFNFPLVLAMRSVAPAIALGNAVILKPDPRTAISGGIVLARLFEEAGLPSGVLQVLPGGKEAGEALVRDSHVDMISFTGSTVVGQRIAELAAPSLKKVALELGGNNAYIVLDDAPVEAASSAGAWSSFFHQGQICMSAGRHIVHERIAEKYVALLAQRAAALKVGNPYQEDVELGPIIDRKQLERIQHIVDATVADGAHLITGGSARGPYYLPTVLTHVQPTMAAYANEIFGPVAPVTIVGSDEEAIEVANASPYGLSAAIQTGSQARAFAIAERLHSGMIHVNDQTVNYESNIPFGGVGLSGNGGRFGGEASKDEFSQWQWFTLRQQSTFYPF
ncbi:benzaldehyde dehydrogenase [Tengunoibacter tsumagoiensis]|uniref:Benzaldehyde dehydrogenase n=1 Tax=Tengunoibacter tsumagoiensis TaxID=2014871 RepID=A0A402A7H1_9CHLR|nr:benzaldehyde dehydrogenase [Tengunoibacter tsumagoiensis]GCE14926.1 benzaldehyde dehydrogenase [Tengunoibacter tsumagoiensis]